MDFYLDQNHWIAVARSIYGVDKDPVLAEIAARMRLVARSGKARFPVSSLNLLEVSKIPDDLRRRRLIEVLIGFSQGWVVAPLVAVLAEELRKWTEGGAPTVDAPVRRGLLSALADYADAARVLGVPEEEVLLEDRFGDSPEAWNFALTQPAFRAVAASVHEAANNYEKRVESVRERWLELDKVERLRAYTLGVVEDLRVALHPLTPPVSAALDRIELDVAAAPYSVIPSLDIMITLGEAKSRDRTRRTDPNDLWDLAFLGIAIPNLDVVLTERLWAHLARAEGISEKYGCEVLSNTHELLPILRGLGD
jgi:hypothetical protein